MAVTSHRFGVNVAGISHDDLKAFFGEVSHWKEGDKKFKNNRVNDKKSVAVPDGYRNALKHFIFTEDCPMPKESDVQVKKFIKGTKRVVKKAIDAGERDTEGRDFITADQFRNLMRFLIASDYYDGPAFLTLSWNLVCRGFTTGGQHANNYTWSGDHMNVVVNASKANKEGSLVPDKPIYGNPYEPEVCFFVQLGFLIIRKSVAGIGDHNALFTSRNEERNFSNRLKILLEKLSEGDKIAANLNGDIGTHSTKKGVMSYSSSFPGMSAVISLLLRAEYKLPGVLNRYFFQTGIIYFIILNIFVIVVLTISHFRCARWR